MDSINKIIKKFEQAIILLLVIIMGIVVLFTTIELIIFIFKELTSTIKEPMFLLDKKELIKIFALFFNVLIGLELFETVKLYLREDIFHAEFVLLVALIAILRKIIIMEFKTWQMTIAIASLVFVLTLGYYFLKKGTINNKNQNNE